MVSSSYLLGIIYIASLVQTKENIILLQGSSSKSDKDNKASSLFLNCTRGVPDLEVLPFAHVSYCGFAL